MQDFIYSGRIADLILAILVVETIVLMLLFGRSPGGSLMTLLGNALAGGGLVLALRGGLVGAAWGWIAGALVLSLVGHLLDLWGRLSRPVRRPMDTGPRP